MGATVTQIHGAERWLDKRELSDILHVSVRWIEMRMREEDPLPHRYRGRAVRYRLSDVLAWEEKRQP